LTKPAAPKTKPHPKTKTAQERKGHSGFNVPKGRVGKKKRNDEENAVTTRGKRQEYLKPGKSLLRIIEGGGLETIRPRKRDERGRKSKSLRGDLSYLLPKK